MTGWGCGNENLNKVRNLVKIGRTAIRNVRIMREIVLSSALRWDKKQKTE